MGWFSDLTGIDTPDWVQDAGAVVANPTVAFYDAQAGAASGKGAATPGGKVIQKPVGDMMGVAGLNNIPQVPGQHTITQAPWAAIQPSLLQGVASANKLTYGPNGLRVPEYQAPGKMTMQGLKAMGAGPSQYLDQAGDFFGQMMQGQENPYLDAQFGKAADSVRQRLDSQFAAAGRYGADAHQNVMADAYNDLATNIYGGAYDADMGRRMQALGMAPGLDSAVAAAGGRQYQAGLIRDGIRDEKANYRYDMGMDRLNNFLASINAAGGNYGSQTQPAPEENKLANFAGLLTGLGAFAGGVGPLFAAGGAAAGAAK